MGPLSHGGWSCSDPDPVLFLIVNLLVLKVHAHGSLRSRSRYMATGINVYLNSRHTQLRVHPNSHKMPLPGLVADRQVLSIIPTTWTPYANPLHHQMQNRQSNAYGQHQQSIRTLSRPISTHGTVRICSERRFFSILELTSGFSRDGSVPSSKLKSHHRIARFVFHGNGAFLWIIEPLRTLKTYHERAGARITLECPFS